MNANVRKSPFLLIIFVLLLTACSSGLEPGLPTLEAQATSSTLRIPITAASDDAEEMSSGGMQLTGGLLDFSAKQGARQTVGLRFAKVNIPQGAKITAAHIEMRAGLSQTGKVTLQVRGEAVNNAATFTTQKHNLSARPKTSAVATWNPNAWTQGKGVQTSSLVGVVQEIVDRSGWRSGNALAFSVTGDGRAERAAIAFGGNPAYVPVLVVTFEGSSQTPAPAPTPTPEPTPAPTSGTLELMVATSADDVEETVTGAMRTGASVNSLDFSVEGGVAQSVGLRFTGVTVPKGSKITRAYIDFKASAADSDSVSLQLYAQAADHAAAFTTGSKNLTSRSKTSASSTWRPNAWRVGQATRTSELAAVVQEIVDRSGWKSGNALVFIVTGDGKTKRSAVSRNASAKDAPILYLTYEPAQQTPPPSAPAPTPPAPEPEPTPEPTPPSSGDVTLWHNRLLSTISTPKYDSSNAWMNPVTQADSGDLNVYGRNLNNYMTSLILAYRSTGDRKLVAQMDSLMNQLRNKLQDGDGDGYRNWLYLNTSADASSSGYYGTDTHEMDEMLTHSAVAAVAYTFKQAGYSSSASFWTDYLKNDFEAKWRKRKNKPSGFPFLTKTLMHTYAQWIRYHYYMGKLTGDSSYLAEANRMAGVVKNNMRTTTTPGGTGYEWDHRVQLSGSASSACQATNYVKYTLQAFADLASQDSSLFDRSFMQRVANTVAHTVLKNTDGTELAGTICGGGNTLSLYYFVSHPFSQLAKWDGSGRLQLATERAYTATERNRESAPRIYNLPAMMVFTLGN